MFAYAAVGVYDDFSSCESCICIGSPSYEGSCWVDMKNGIVVNPVFADWFYDFADDVFSYSFIGYTAVMLC